VKQIDIQDQVRLGFLRTLGMTVNGMRHRLGRSVVTMLVIVVAIAFLMNTLSESLLKQSVSERLGQRIAELRISAGLATHLSQPESGEALLRRFARAREDKNASRELQGMGGFDEAALAELSGQAALGSQILDWLGELNYGQYRMLLHNTEGIQAFDRLGDPAHRQRFGSILRGMPSLQLPIPEVVLERFLGEWPAVKEQLDRTRTGWQQAADRLAVHLGGRTMMEALTDAEGEFGEHIRQAGFQLESAAAGRAADQARRILERQRIEQVIDDSAIRIIIAQRLDILPGAVDPPVLWRLLGHRTNAAWFLQRMKDAGYPTGEWTAEHLAELAELHAEDRTIASVAWLGDSTDRRILDQQLLWLIGASLLVCMVGITNAMLMSVTQRFREIATMKCLGALDSYIAMAFILEACMLGLVGGLLGAAIGLLIGLGRMYVAFGNLLAGAIPAGSLLQAMGSALLLGVLLAAAATVLPALKAARLAPMEAMRVE